MDLIKIKVSICENHVKRGKEKLQMRRKYLQTMHLTKDWYLEYINISQCSRIKYQIPHKMGKSLEQSFPWRGFTHRT